MVKTKSPLIIFVITSVNKLYLVKFKWPSLDLYVVCIKVMAYGFSRKITLSN